MKLANICFKPFSQTIKIIVVLMFDSKFEELSLLIARRIKYQNVSGLFNYFM